VVAIGDTAFDGRLTPPERAALRLIEVGAVLGIPLNRDGQLVAVFSAHDRDARTWTDDEIAIAHETAARTWPWVERARVQGALRGSEAKYRALFDAVDEGFCVIEMVDHQHPIRVDYRFVEANEAFRRQTGLGDVAGKLGSDVELDLGPSWLETCSCVARTGESARFESYHRNAGRWSRVLATRVEEAGPRQVAMVFTDITARREREQAATANPCGW
jgi:PAS domain-containing protein